MKCSTIFHLVAVLIFVNSNLYSQVVIEWQKAHKDTKMDYLGWNEEMMRATLTRDHNFRTQFVGHHPDAIINYINWDGSHWTARLNGDRFVHAPDGRFESAHEDSRMDYKAANGSNWSATISGNGFMIYPQGGSPQQSAWIYYKTWNGDAWTAELEKPNFIHTPGTVGHPVTTSSSIAYRTWNGSRWTATIHADGTFTHTSEQGARHDDYYILYQNYDHSFWAMRPEGTGFIHAPAYVPKDRSFWDKIDYSLSHIDLQGGFPTQTQTPGKPVKEFRGIIVKIENKVMWYIPVGNMNICGDDIAMCDVSTIISKIVAGNCYRHGNNSQIYLFRYQEK